MQLLLTKYVAHFMIFLHNVMWYNQLIHCTVSIDYGPSTIGFVMPRAVFVFVV